MLSRRRFFLAFYNARSLTTYPTMQKHEVVKCTETQRIRFFVRCRVLSGNLILVVEGRFLVSDGQNIQGSNAEA